MCLSWQDFLLYPHQLISPGQSASKEIKNTILMIILLKCPMMVQRAYFFLQDNGGEGQVQ